MELTTGIKGKAEDTVTAETSALSMGSGTLEVYATPAMVALMEKAAYQSIEPFLEEGRGSVGIEMNVRHLSATPLGCAVFAEAVVTAVEDRTITFSVEAFDSSGKIGEGTHKRVIIGTQRFLEKAKQKTF